MTSKRPLVLMAVLLVLVLGYLTRPLWETRLTAGSARASLAPLPGQNRLGPLEVRQDDKGRWMASFDYFYTGAPAEAQLHIGLGAGADGSQPIGPPHWSAGRALPQRGAHRIDIEIGRPYGEAATTTRRVTATLGTWSQVIATQSNDTPIEWLSFHDWFRQREFASQSPDQTLARAVALIDTQDASSLHEAKRLLERLLVKNPKFDQAYVELARVAMKTNWGPEGLHQAENLLTSALQIQPGSANAQILLGYVYAHQGRYKAAEPLFAAADRPDTKNLWLWANWGELLLMQGKLDAAALKYREAITRPPTGDTYDNARRQAYRNLLMLLDKRKDLDAIEALHKQRVGDYGGTSCYGVDYARFMLQQRGNTAAAIELAQKAMDAHCAATEAREVLGLAHYVAWAAAPAAQRDGLINQARIYLPAGPRLMYGLASSERSVAAARQLLAQGESIDQRDNAKLNALALAMQDRDHAAARRLLRLGARAEARVGFGDVPVAMGPVMTMDFDGIRLMQQFGVDYSKLRYDGSTALEHAKRAGDRRLIEALDPKTRSL